VKHKNYQAAITDENGFVLTPHSRLIFRQNLRNTAREEAIAASVLQQANPRENITGSHPWGPEEQWVRQQLWIHDTKQPEWRDEPRLDRHLYSVVETEYGPLPVPETIKQPGQVPMDLAARVKEALGED